LRAALEPLASRIGAAFVYGSVARGDERGRSDLDVMIIGEAKFADIVHALAPAREALRREINPNVYPAGEFAAKLAGEPFLQRVMTDKKIFLIGTSDDLGKLAGASESSSPTPQARSSSRACWQPRSGRWRTPTSPGLVPTRGSTSLTGQSCRQHSPQCSRMATDRQRANRATINC
jgi:predicted nucleotidyltransferase